MNKLGFLVGVTLFTLILLFAKLNGFDRQTIAALGLIALVGYAISWLVRDLSQSKARRARKVR
jgi:DMSO reductase anchor subunit